MLTKTVTRLQHPLVKHWISLRKDRPYREQEKRVLISGKKMVGEFPSTLRTLITLDKSETFPAQEHITVTEEILKKITGLEEPDGFAAVVDLPKPQDLSRKQFLLIADQISDPGNFGTLLRTAFALGWEGVIATPGTVDFFNDKALRAAKGATFRLPFSWKTPEEIILWVKKNQIRLFLADLSGPPLSKISLQPPIALILSHEAKGPRSWSKKIAETVSIPMQEEAESLNVAIAGAILLYAMRHPI